MKRIPLTNSHLKKAKIDDEDWDRVRPINWCLLKGGYVLGHIPAPISKSVYLHRFIMNAEPGQEFDHTNGDKLDCRKINLRPCSRSQNQANRVMPRNNSTGYKGVYLHGPTGRFQARLSKKSLGYFDTAIEAAQAYNDAAKTAFGAFANLNKLYPR